MCVYYASQIVFPIQHAMAEANVVHVVDAEKKGGCVWKRNCMRQQEKTALGALKHCKRKRQHDSTCLCTCMNSCTHWHVMRERTQCVPAYASNGCRSHLSHAACCGNCRSHESHTAGSGSCRSHASRTTGRDTCRSHASHAACSDNSARTRRTQYGAMCTTHPKSHAA